MAAPPGINDEFNLEGFWWLPDNPDLRVAGVLAFNQNDGPVLTLTGTFSPAKEAFRSELEDRPTIHGITKDGKAVSLFDALQTSRKGGLGQTAVHEVYKGHLFAVGLHFAAEDDPIFTKPMSVSKTSKNGWAIAFSTCIPMAMMAIGRSTSTVRSPAR